MIRLCLILAAFVCCSPVYAQQTAGPLPTLHSSDGRVESGPLYTFMDDKLYQYGLDSSKNGKLFFIVVPSQYSPPASARNGDWIDPLENWKSPQTAKWLAEHGIAAVYRQDYMMGLRGPSIEDMHRKLQRTPAGIVAIRNGQVVDRTSHFATSEELLAWLKLINENAITLDYARKVAGERKDGGPLVPRLVLAWRLDKAGRTEEADAEYEWVLEQTFAHEVRDGDWKDPRGQDRYESSSHPYRERGAAFAKKDPAAKARIIVLRDSYAAKTEAATDEMDRFRAQNAWFALYRIVPDPDRLIAWFKTQPPESREARGMGSRNSNRRRVFHLLTESGRWADAGALIDRPFGWAAGSIFEIAATEYMSADDRQKDQDQALRRARIHAAEESGQIYAALLAAGRESTAQAVAEVLEELDAEDENDTIRRGLILMAIEAGQTRPIHLQWAGELDKTPTKDKKLTPLVEEALKSQPPR